MASTSAHVHERLSGSEAQLSTQPQHNNAVEMTELDQTAKSVAMGESKSLSGDESVPSGSTTVAPIVPGEVSREPDVIPTSTTAVDSSDPTTASTAEAAPELSLSAYNATAPTSTTTADAPPALSRLDSVAIGPSTDSTPVIPINTTENPACIITLLLTSGARHPYRLDEKYLTKRNVPVPDLNEAGKKDPFSISVYTLKELILREWREEWDGKPSSPSSIRLIHFGRLLDDKTPLKECRFNADTPNVVHMTVKPQDIVDDEEALRGKTGGREREGEESTPGCRCVIL